MKAKLTLEIDYDTNGVSSHELAEMVLDIARNAANAGLMTGETAAEVAVWTARVEMGDGLSIRD